MAHGGGEVLHGLRVPAFARFEHAQAVVGPRELRRAAQDAFELGSRRRVLASHVERRPEPVAQRRVLRLDLEAAAELCRRLVPVLAIKRAEADRFEGLRALQQFVDLDHQRIGRQDVVLAAQFEMTFRAACVAEPAVGERQWIMGARRLRIAREHIFQMLDGAAVLLLRQRRPAQAKARRERARLPLEHSRKPGFSGVGIALRQIDVAQPERGGHLVRLQFEDPLEERRGVRQITFAPRKMREVIRPSMVSGIQRLRVDEIRLGSLGLSGHEQPAHLAEGCGQFCGRGLAFPERRRQGRIAVADLRLH